MPSSPDVRALDALRGRRVVVVSTEQPGTRMAGPAIRATNLAREIGRRGARVTLASQRPPDTDIGIDVVDFKEFKAATFRGLARDADVVISQPLRVDVARGLHAGGARVIYDLYVPSYVEYPASQAGQDRPADVKQTLISRNQMEYAAAIDCGDAFLCASQRQRDHWLGALGQAGRLVETGGQPAESQRHPGPAVAVVPFGLPDVPPPGDPAAVMRGGLVPHDSFILLWAGGLWNWFDPKTVIAALNEAVTINPAIRLVVMGGRHASQDWEQHSAADLAVEHAAQLGLVGSGHVVVVDSWVPYEARAAFLAEADLGVCAYFDSDETRLSFRTRFLDHLWAGLPTLTTQGGALTEQMERAGAARCLPARDVDAWTKALLDLASAPAELTSMSNAALTLAAEYRWSVVAQPLVALVADLAGQTGEHRRPSALAISRYLSQVARTRLRMRSASRH